MLAQLTAHEMRRAAACARAMRLREKVGIPEKADVPPARLSGGQQQRVAIAAGLAMEPRSMLFDEPTSALDAEMIREVLDVMRDLAREGMTMLVVTHEVGFAREASNRVVFMDGGRIIEDSPTREFFAARREERAKQFLSKVIRHSSPEGGAHAGHDTHRPSRTGERLPRGLRRSEHAGRVPTRRQRQG